MAELDPELARQIVALVLSTIAPYSIAGLVAGIVAGTIVSLTMAKKIVIPGARKEVISAMTDPKGEVQALRAKEREQTMADLDAKLAAFKKDFVPPDLDAFKAELKALKDGFNGAVPLLNNLTEENLTAVVDKVLSNHRKAANARGEPGPDGELTPAQKAEVERLKENPDGVAQLAAAKKMVQIAVDQDLLKGTTGKALIKQLESALESGQDLDQILAPYRAIFDRFSGTAPGVRMLPKAGKTSGFNPG